MARLRVKVISKIVKNTIKCNQKIGSCLLVILYKNHGYRQPMIIYKNALSVTDNLYVQLIDIIKNSGIDNI